jgi:hypothetical protein
MSGPMSGKCPYDPPSPTPGITPVRQAHRAALRSGGIRVEPGWVVGALLAAALLSTRLIVGSAGGAVPTVRPITADQSRFSVALASTPIASADPVGGTSVESPGGVPNPASRVRWRMVAMSAIGTAGVVVASGASRPKAIPRPKAMPRPTTTARPKATPRQTAAHTTKPAVPATAAMPRSAPTPKPALAIDYLHQAAGRATWGRYDGAVITRLAPGTRIRVCGRIGCWEGVSSGYGPSAGGGNLVDMDAAVFRRVCGPLRTGVGSIVLSWR